MSEEPVTGDVVVDAGDEKYVKYRARNARQHDAIKSRVVRNLMASIDGREWMYELLNECHVYESSWSSDASLMAFREGHRSIGIWLIKQIEVHCREQYLLMVKEAKDRADVVS